MNTIGSYKCKCNAGYALQADGSCTGNYAGKHVVLFNKATQRELRREKDTTSTRCLWQQNHRVVLFRFIVPLVISVNCFHSFAVPLD